MFDPEADYLILYDYKDHQIEEKNVLRIIEGKKLAKLFPGWKESKTVKIFSGQTGIKVKKAQVWEMASTNMY